jgi:hypothetical protein
LALLAGYSDHGDVAAVWSVERLKDLLTDNDRARVSLDRERADETYVLEHRGRSWLVFFLERGRKRDLRKHDTEDEACRDLLRRLGADSLRIAARRLTHCSTAESSPGIDRPHAAADGGAFSRRTPAPPGNVTPVT